MNLQPFGIQITYFSFCLQEGDLSSDFGTRRHFSIGYVKRGCVRLHAYTRPITQPTRWNLQNILVGTPAHSISTHHVFRQPCMKQATQFACTTAILREDNEMMEGKKNAEVSSAGMESICIVIGPLRIDVIACTADVQEYSNVQILIKKSSRISTCLANIQWIFTRWINGST